MGTEAAQDQKRRPLIKRINRDTGQLDELSLELSPRVSSLAALAEMIEEFGNSNSIPQNTIFLINLEVDELLTNYVTHSLHRVRFARIRLKLRAYKEKVTLEMIDSGPPFNPLQFVPPNTDVGIEEREVGGLGLHLVKTYSDRMGYECIDGCNRITIQHNITAENEK